MQATEFIRKMYTKADKVLEKGKMKEKYFAILNRNNIEVEVYNLIDNVLVKDNYLSETFSYVEEAVSYVEYFKDRRSFLRKFELSSIDEIKRIEFKYSKAIHKFDSEILSSVKNKLYTTK